MPAAGTSSAANTNTAAEASQPSDPVPPNPNTSTEDTPVVEPSPERPSNPGSPRQNGMEVDPPVATQPPEPPNSDAQNATSNSDHSNETSNAAAIAPTSAVIVPNQTQNLGLENDATMDHDHESSNASTLESPNVSQASTSGDVPANGTTHAHIADSSILVKTDPASLLSHGDVQMVPHDENDLASATTRTVTPLTTQT